MTDLGIIEELDAACLPRPGEAVIQWVNGYERRLGAAEFHGGKVIYIGQWDEFAPSYCGPWAPPAYPSVGDIVTPL